MLRLSLWMTKPRRQRLQPTSDWKACRTRWWSSTASSPPRTGGSAQSWPQTGQLLQDLLGLDHLRFLPRTDRKPGCRDENCLDPGTGPLVIGAGQFLQVFLGLVTVLPRLPLRQLLVSGWGSPYHRFKYAFSYAARSSFCTGSSSADSDPHRAITPVMRYNTNWSYIFPLGMTHSKIEGHSWFQNSQNWN